MPPAGCRCVWGGAGCRVQGAGCRVWGAGCRVQGVGCRVQGAGCREWGAPFESRGPRRAIFTSLGPAPRTRLMSSILRNNPAFSMNTKGFGGLTSRVSSPRHLRVTRPDLHNIRPETQFRERR